MDNIKDKNEVIGCVCDIFLDDTQTLQAERILSLIIEKTKFKAVKRLPFSDLPRVVRINEQNPSYEINPKEEGNDRYKVVIGEGAVGIALSEEKQYVSWQDFYEKIKAVYEPLFNEEIFQEKTIKRIGFRLIYFLEDIDISDYLKIPNTEEGARIFLQKEEYINGKNFKCCENLVNLQKSKKNDKKHGSVVDIIIHSTETDFCVRKENYEKFLNFVKDMNKHIEEKYNKIKADIEKQ